MATPVRLDKVGATDNLEASVRRFRGTAAIAVGDAVSLDTADTTYGPGYSVKKADDTGNQEGMVVGIAIEAITAAGDAKVQVVGLYKSANVATGVAVGQLLTASAVAGRLQAHPGGAGYRVIAVALSAEASNKADVWVLDPASRA